MSTNQYDLPSDTLQILQKTFAQLLDSVAEELIPKPIPPTREWAQDNFKLPVESGEIYGEYDLNYAPYMKGIFAALDDPNIQEVVVQKAAQVGWTFALIAWIFKNIALAPCAIVGMFAKEAAGKEFNDEKLVPCIRSTPALNRIIDVGKSRSATNSTLFKSFTNGFLKLVGSKSISSVKSTPAKIVFVEEPDDSIENLKNQGSAIKLLWERTKRIRNSKRVMGGTPSIKGASKVEEHIKRSDKRVLPIQCHDCEETHVLTWDSVDWLDADSNPHEIYGLAMPETAVYVCPFCGSKWDDYQRKKNIVSTVNAAEAQGDPMFGWVATAPFHGVAGFKDLSELYSCLPGVGLAALVVDYLGAEYEAAHGDETERMVFINSKLAQTYEYQGDNLTADELREKALDYPEDFCPAGGLLMTVGIDVQHDRIAIVRRAFGRQDEAWGFTWKEIYAKGSTADKSDPVWKDLENIVFSSVKHESGASLYPSAISIDSSDGQTNDAVYSWVRSMSKLHREVLVMAIKGSSDQADPEIFSTPRAKGVDHKNPKKQSKADKWGLKVYMVGTNKAKDYVAAHMRLDGVGPGRYHMSKHVRSDYFDQVTGEVKAPHRTLKNRKVWQQKSGCAVEAWDCEIYALHAARAKRVHLKTPQEWDALEQKLLQADLFATEIAAPEAQVESSGKPEPIKVVASPSRGAAKPKSLGDIARRMN